MTMTLSFRAVALGTVLRTAAYLGVAMAASDSINSFEDVCAERRSIGAVPSGDDGRIGFMCVTDDS
jgi:hypothetical protein